MITSDSSAASAGGDGGRGIRDDILAWSGQVEDQARRVLASGGPDAETAEAIKNALAQVEAARSNGESTRESTMHLQQVLDHDELRRG